jgi:putative endonuclease
MTGGPLRMTGGSLRMTGGDGRQRDKEQKQMKHYYVYILANHSKTLYTGVTNNLERRLYEHKHHLVVGFTSKYHVTRLVYFEETSDVQAALAREKCIKG